ncbi:MAG: hypothetical protein C0518_07255 [Opitutus sp.]|nr:hypothetical protein [Opitutus sp.]
MRKGGHEMGRPFACPFHPPANYRPMSLLSAAVAAVREIHLIGTCRRTARPILAPILVAAFAAAGPLSATESSEPSALAARSMLLDVTRAGERLFAVGDRGHVVVSSDEGETWAQCITPTRAMLTGVSFADADHGWAVGHDGVIIATQDAGKSWVRQDDGKDLDTVYLDVLFLSPTHGFVVGAYGKFLVTRDGGKTWTPRRIAEDDLHFNRITNEASGTLFIAGEAGTLLVSRDRGETWQRSELDYEGSLYGVRPLSGGVLVAYGLRGRIFVSTDDGATWEPRESEVKVLIMSGARLRDGVVVLAGQGGNFFISRDSGRTFRHWKPDDFGTSVADLAVTKDGTLLTVGEAGAVKIKIP